MELFLASLAVLASGIWLGRLTIETARRYGVGVDATDAPHKSHLHWVPRLGVFPVAVSLIVGLLLLAWMTAQHEKEAAFLIVCLLPAFAIGLLEDLLQNLGTVIRLAFTMVSAALAWWLLEARLDHVDLPLVDEILALHALAGFIFTIVAVAGVAHAFNIIDGCNGLSSFAAMVALVSMALVAHQVGDVFIFSTALLAACAVLGFFFWNFPFGRLFLGDGGAYVTGLLTAVLAILLVQRNPQVSPWFPMLLMAYPVWETLYSAYRRLVIQRWSAVKPDRLHLHNLVYGRLVRMNQLGEDANQQALRSSITATYLWIPILACAAVAVLFWDDAAMLQFACMTFATCYVLLYRALVRFDTPRRLIFRQPIRGFKAPPPA